MKFQNCFVFAIFCGRGKAYILSRNHAHFSAENREHFLPDVESEENYYASNDSSSLVRLIRTALSSNSSSPLSEMHEALYQSGLLEIFWSNLETLEPRLNRLKTNSTAFVFFMTEVVKDLLKMDRDYIQNMMLTGVLYLDKFNAWWDRQSWPIFNLTQNTTYYPQVSDQEIALIAGKLGPRTLKRFDRLWNYLNKTELCDKLFILGEKVFGKIYYIINQNTNCDKVLSQITQWILSEDKQVVYQLVMEANEVLGKIIGWLNEKGFS